MTAVRPARSKRAICDLPDNQGISGSPPLTPTPVRDRAGKAFRLWEQNPGHPLLRFRLVHPAEPIYSVRIGLGWRAVGVRRADRMVSFRVGTHAEYHKLISSV